MSDKRFVVQEDANTDAIILLLDYKRMWRYSFLAEEREAVQKICDLLNELSDENGQLKEENERLQEHIRLLTTTIERMIKKMNEIYNLSASERSV